MLEFMVAQLLRGYNGAFDFVFVMNMDSRLFYTYYNNLIRINLFENGEWVDGIHEEKKKMATKQDINKIKKWQQL